MVTTTWRAAAAAVATVPLLGLLAACGGSSSGSGSPTLDITSPANGAHVGSAFPVTWHASVSLGAPDTGRDHVHVFVDGHANDYTVVGGDQFMLKGLTPGKHTVDVRLSEADGPDVGHDFDCRLGSQLAERHIGDRLLEPDHAKITLADPLAGGYRVCEDIAG